MKCLKFGWLIVSGLLSQSLNAADLNIQIREKGTGDPVEGASVLLLDSGDSDITDENGNTNFEDIELPTPVKILSLGYETLTVSADDAATTIFLEPLSTEGEALVVQEDRIQQKTSKVVIPIETLKRAPGTGGDPVKVVESLPGVVVNSSGGGGGIYVRGSDQNQNVVWVDRARIGYLFHMGGLYSTINPDIIQDFNAFLGGFPVEYDNVLGGALDVKLRSPKRDRVHKKVSLGTYQSSLFAEGPIGEKNSPHGFFVAARRSYIDLLFTPETFTSNFLEDDDTPDDLKNEVVQIPVFHDIQAVWEYESPYGLFTTSFFNAKDEARFVFNENKLIDPEAAGETGISVGFSTLSINWERNWGGGVSHTAPLTFRNTQQRFELGKDENGDPFYMDIEDRVVSWQPEIKWARPSGNEWYVGTQFAYAETPVDAKISREPSESDIGDFILTDRKKFTLDRLFKGGIIAPYASYRHVWNSRFNTTLGLRYSFLKVTGGAEFDALLPRIHAEYKLWDKTYLTGAWGRYVQQPKGSEMAIGVGNPNLFYLKSEHRILGFKSEFMPRWSLLVEVFHKPMYDLVTAIDENDPPDNYSNQGKGEAKGIDVLVKRDFANDRTGWLSYSYIEATRTGRDGVTRRFSGDQPHTLSLVWSQGLSGGWSKWDIGFRFRYHTGQPFDPVIGVTTSADSTRNVPVYPDKKNADRLPDFYQLDLRLDREVLFNTWKMNFYVDILNVLNTKNVVGYDYGNNLENVDNPDEKYSLPLFPTFGIEAEF